MLSGYSRFLDGIERVLYWILAFLIGAMTLVMIYQVVLRYVFNNANIWAEELIKFMFIWSVMLGGCIAVRKNSHLRIEVFIDMLSPAKKAWIQIVTYSLVMAFLAVLLVLGLVLVSNTTVNRSAGLGVPMAIPYFSVPLGAFLMMLACVEFMLKNVEGARQRGASLSSGKD